MSTLKNLLIGDRRDPREELAEIFHTEVPRSADAPPAAIDWARTTLTAASIDTTSVVAAIAALRKAEPKLGLKSATYLAERLAR